MSMTNIKPIDYNNEYDYIKPIDYNNEYDYIKPMTIIMSMTI